jgi:hypothetical protein
MLTTLCRSQLNDRNNAFAFADPKTATKDCNVAMLSEGLELSRLKALLSAAEIRQLGSELDGPTGNVLARRVMVKLGLKPELEYRMLSIAPAQTVRDLLRAGWYVVQYVDCGWLQDHSPELVGDRFYRGAHAVALFDFWRGQLGASTHLANPLFDGRQRGSWTAPAGVQSVKYSDIRDAAYAYTGNVGLTSGYAIRPATLGV